MLRRKPVGFSRTGRWSEVRDNFPKKAHTPVSTNHPSLPCPRGPILLFSENQCCTSKDLTHHFPPFYASLSRVLACSLYWAHPRRALSICRKIYFVHWICLKVLASTLQYSILHWNHYREIHSNKYKFYLDSLCIHMCVCISISF